MQQVLLNDVCFIVSRFKVFVQQFPAVSLPESRVRILNHVLDNEQTTDVNGARACIKIKDKVSNPAKFGQIAPNFSRNGAFSPIVNGWIVSLRYRPLSRRTVTLIIVR